MHTQTQALSRRPHVVIATPGRLAALFASEYGLSDGFKRLACLVLDEADRVLEVSLADDLKRVLMGLPEKRQTLLFSATMEESLAKVQRAGLKNVFVF